MLPVRPEQGLPMSHPRTTLALVALTALAAPPARAEAPFRYREGKHGKAELKYVAGIPVLTVAGTPEEIGEQIGTLAVRPLKPLEKTFHEFLKRKGADKLWPLLVKACNGLLGRAPADHRAELFAMAKAGGFDRDLLVVANTVPDVLKVGGCSTLVVEPARSASGELLFGRNLDVTPMKGLAECGLVTVYRPKGKRAFVAVGFPGTLGPSSAMNDAGLALAVDEIYSAADGSPRFDPEGVPMLAVFRRIVEECATVGEAEKLLRSVKRTTYLSLTVCDRKGGVVFEVTPKSVVVRRPEKGLCFCTNHFRTKELASSTGCWRYPLLDKTRAIGKVKLADVARKLHEVNQGAATMQTMVFEPASRRLHLALGKGPSSARPLRAMDMAPFLRGKVTR
jgi:isopenicillin-N N-acyltransferase-like protein